MCGRYSLTTPVDGVRRLFAFPEIPNLAARYNIAPTQAVLTVGRAADARPNAYSGGGGVVSGGSATGGPGGSGRRAFWTRWGLIPNWAKDPSVGAKMINARAETIREKPAFRTAFRRRRCLIPADGFYEWKTVRNGGKQPWRITFQDEQPFAFAGIWENWQSGDGSDVDSCSIVTTEAAPEISDIHHRMPVILDESDFDVWLEGEPDDAARLMHPYTGPRSFKTFTVSRAVNNVRNDDSSLIEPMDPPGQENGTPGPDQLSLF